MWNLYDTNFYALNFYAHFDYLSLFSGTQAEKDGNPKTKYEKCERDDKNQIECHEIEPDPSNDGARHEGDNPLFWDQFIMFVLPSWINIRISKLVPKYLATGL
jgi:hypothetical protein